MAICTCIVHVCNNTLLHAFTFVGRCVYIYIYDLIDYHINIAEILYIMYSMNTTGLLYPIPPAYCMLGLLACSEA